MTRPGTVVSPVASELAQVTREEATILLLQKAVLDRLQQINATDRGRIAARMVVGESTPGEQLDGQPIGKVKMVNPAGGVRKPVVTNRAAYMDWLRANQPDAITPGHFEQRWVPDQIADGVEKAHLAQLKKDGGLIDANGEIVPVDFLELVDQPGSLRVEVDTEVVGELVDQLLASARLSLPELTDGRD